MDVNINKEAMVAAICIAIACIPITYFFFQWLISRQTLKADSLEHETMRRAIAAGFNPYTPYRRAGFPPGTRFYP